jgi:4'-phosphopantetheinyl transferase EntD
MAPIQRLLKTEAWSLFYTQTPLPFSCLKAEHNAKLERLSNPLARHHALLALYLRDQFPETAQAVLPRFASISHGEDIALMAMHEDPNQVIGVDLEASHRPIHPRLFDKLTPSLLEKSCVKTLPLLALWSVKEALWKAWKNNHLGLLKDLTITEVAASRLSVDASVMLLFTGRASTPCGTILGWHLYEIEMPQAGQPLFYVAVATTF